MKLRPGLASRKVFTGQPSFVDVGTFKISAGADSLSAPTAVAGDILVIVMETNTAGIAVATTGYAHVTGSPVDGADTQLQVLWKRATGSSNDIASFPDVAPADHWAANMISIRGCLSGGIPWNAVAADIQAAGTAISIPAITTTVDKNLILVAVANGVDLISTTEFNSVANASLTSVTERFDNISNVGGGGGVWCATGIQALRGSTGVTTITKVNSAATARMVIAFTAHP